MIKIDKSQWPIVQIETDGLATVEAMAEYNATMDDLLAQAEGQDGQFGLIFISDMSDEEYKAHKREKAAQKLSNDWLRANRARMTKQCVAIAMVTKATGIMRMFKPIARMTMKRMMGAPGDLFFTIEEATTWMNKQLHSTAVNS
ncbi:MAG: hypothetical protein AAFR67_01485 [Chloroflexota bacterium]